MNKKEIEKIRVESLSNQANILELFAHVKDLKGINIFCLILFFVLYIAFMVHIYDTNIHKVCTEQQNIKTFLISYESIEFKYNDNVICESSVKIHEYKAIDKKVVYPCLNIVNGVCENFGKKCYLEEKVKVCK